MRRLGREQWRELIAEYEAGDFAQKEFAAKQDVSLATFQFHLYKTRKERGTTRSSESSPAFLPVEVVTSAALKARRQDADAIEAMFRSGVILRFDVGTDTRYLAELFAALG